MMLVTMSMMLVMMSIMIVIVTIKMVTMLIITAISISHRTNEMNGVLGYDSPL